MSTSSARADGLRWLDGSRRATAAIALATLGLHLAFAERYGWFRDELYYAACSRRLAWGYVDHPPVVAMVARIARAAFGDSLIGLRAFAALAGAITVVLGGELARELGGGRFAICLASFAVAIAPYDLAVAHIYTMNAFEPLVWAAAGLVVVRAIGREAPRALLWLGPIIGLGLLNKHSVVWLVGGLAAGLALSPSRRLFLRKEVWIAGAIAALVVAPHVRWQMEHGWPTREFMRGALAGKNLPYTPLGFLGRQIELAHPLAAPLWIAGLGGLAFARSLRPYRPLAVAWLAITTLLVATQAKAYYLAPAYPWLFAAGAVVLERATRKAAWVRTGYAVLLLIGTALLLPMTVPVLSVETFQRYAAALGGIGEAKSGEKLERGALPQIYADMHGWPELAATVADVIDTLPPEDRAALAVLADNYGEASAIEMFGRARSIPPVISGSNGWWLWGPGDPTPRLVVAVGFDRQELLDLFDEVVEVARVDHPLARPDERNLQVFVCRMPTVPLDQAWPRLKHYR